MPINIGAAAITFLEKKHKNKHKWDKKETTAKAKEYNNGMSAAFRTTSQGDSRPTKHQKTRK